MPIGSPPAEDDNSLGILTTSLFRRITFQEDLVNSYQDLEKAMQIQERRGNELEQEIRGWVAIASPFFQFVQIKFERSRADGVSAMPKPID